LFYIAKFANQLLFVSFMFNVPSTCHTLCR